MTECFFVITHLIQRHQLELVAEQDVDVVQDEVHEVVTVTINAERIRQRERHLATGFVRVLCCDAEGLLGMIAVEQIPLEEHHRRGLHRLPRDVVGVEQRRRAEERAHRSLTIRRDGDDAATGRLGLAHATRMEADTDTLHVTGERITEGVLGDLADEPCTPTEACKPVGGVGSRSTARLRRIGDAGEQMRRTIGIDECHRTLDDVFIHEESVFDRCDHVDEGIADRHDVIGQARVAREVDWRHVGKP